MAVLRNNQEGIYNTTATIGSTGALLCMVVAILGIKLKWFRHRMTFDSNIPTAPERGATTSNDQPILLTGVFKQNIDFDSFVDIKQPKQLPPVRVHKTSKIILPPKKEPYQNGTASQPLLTNGIAVKPAVEQIVPQRPTQLDVSPSYRNDSIISNGPPPALPLSPPPPLEENGFGEEILTIVVPQPENKTIKFIPPPPPYSPPRPAQPEEHKIHFIKKQQVKQPSSPLESTKSPNLSNSMPNLNATNNNHNHINNNNQNPVLALSIPNINAADPLPTPAKKGFFGFPSKEKKKETEKPKKILKVKKTKEPKPVKVKEAKPAKPIKEKETKIKDLQRAAAPETIPKSLEPFLKVKVQEKEVGAAYNDQITIRQPTVGATYNDTITIKTKSEVGAAYNDQITFKPPSEVGATSVKPIPRTTGINYATQVENGYNDSIAIVDRPIASNKSFVRLESYDEIKHRHKSQPTTPKLDDDDDFGNWNAVARHRKGITQTTAVVQAAQVKTTVRTNAAAAVSNDNANLLMERPKTLREQQSAQRNNNNSSSSSNRDNSGFKLRRSDSEESDTEA